MTRLLYTILISTFIYTINAQPINKYINDVVLPTPNEAALGKYGDIPVSHYTGIPNISVPIHTLAEASLSHNVSLNYHAGGVRVAEVASRVGLNWSLKAGGFISRSVNGLRDDNAVNGYYHKGSELYPTSEEDFLGLAAGTKDGEADIFTFSCGSHYGQFYYNDAQEVTLIPKQDIEIEVSETSDGNFESFIVTTPDGNRHYFGKYGGVLAQDTMYASLSAEPYVSNWHLLRVETYDRAHHINFGYEEDRYSYTVPASCRFYQKTCSNQSGSSSDIGFSCGGALFQIGSQAASQNYFYNTINIVGKRLSSISTSTETVTFTSNTTRLDLRNSDITSTNKKS